FQAEDGIRDFHVTGVQTCALPILGLDIRTVGDMGELPDALPVFLFPDVPLTMETLRIILPVSATLAVVGLLESLMTAQIVEDMKIGRASCRERQEVGIHGRRW